MADSTELLSYALLLFLVFVYLPYAFFTLFAERFIDLGRRRDSTQLEEIISAFLPSLLFHLPVFLVYVLIIKIFQLTWTFDFAAVAAMFGKDRGAISDYVYAGDWIASTTYIGMLWLFASLLGLWFGKAAEWVCQQDAALDGVDEIKLSDIHGVAIPIWVKWGGWHPWSLFFRESFVPLFTWRAQDEKKVSVRVEMNDHRVYCGVFHGYEKTTDGRIEVIRLSEATRHSSRETPARRLAIVLNNCIGKSSPKRAVRLAPSNPAEVTTALRHVYLKWDQVAELRMLQKKTAPQAGANK